MRIKKLTVFYLLAVHAALAAAVLTPNLITRVQAKVGLVDPAQQRIEFGRMVVLDRVDPAVPEGANIFLGNSITQALVTSSVIDNSVNLGVGSQNTAQLAEMAEKLHSLRTAKRVFLSIGTNDIGPGRRGFTRAAAESVLKSIPPEALLVWSGIKPREGYEDEIAAANRIVVELCASRPGCTYVDTRAVFADGDGHVLPGMYIDGVHPTAAGYGRWIEALKAAI